MDSAVRQVFESYPASVRRPLLQIREAIFELAKNEELGA
jgi:hypothetical protein